MKRNWIKWIALGLTVGMLGIMVPAVAHAEEATDSVITEEVQEPVTEEEVTPDVPSDDPKITESVPEAPVEDDAESAEDAAVLEYDVANIQLYSASGYGSWRQTNGRWWFRFTDGTYAFDDIYTINGIDYAFDKSGWMITGWYKYRHNGEWYYFDASGKMCYGWLKLGTNWYYLDPGDGFMYSDVWTKIGGYYYMFNANGSMYTGWFKYIYNDGSFDWYYFDAKGHEAQGWLKIGGKWYFFNNDPDDDDGWMYSDCWSDIDGACYRFDTSGAMHIGWYKHIFSDGTYDWYYYNTDGKEQRGWLKLGTKWYYLDTNDGWMYRDGVEIIDGINYGFDTNGVMLTGWCKNIWNDYAGVDWFYFDANGMGHEGWLQHKGAWYYFKYGMMAQDAVIETGNDKYSRFGPDGKWLGYTNPLT